MELLNSLMDPGPSTSNANLPLQALHSVNLTNLTLNGAKMFTDSADRSKFMSEFSQLQIQNPTWSPVRLIRERLQLQMRIQNAKLLKQKERGKKAPSVNNTPKTKRKQKKETDSENEEQEEFSTLNDRLMNSVNEQIESSRFIELDESKTVCVQADNVLVIDAGDGKCVILNCQELLELNRDNLQSSDDIRWLNASRTSAANGQELNGTAAGNRLKRKSHVNHLNPTRSGRIKHSCLQCPRTFTNTDSFMKHMKENHIFEELDEELDVKPDREFIQSLTRNGCVS